MAEPTNPGQPSDSSTERGSPVNVETSGNVTVTRKDVATGDVKDLQADLLEALCECIKDQTKTLSGVIDKTKKSIVDAVKAGGGSGGGSGSGGSGPSGGPNGGDGRSKNEKERDAEMLKSLNNIADELKGVLAKSTAGGGEGDPHAGSSRISAEAATSEYDAMEKIIGSTTIKFEEFGNLFNKGLGVEFKRNIGNINKSLFDFGQSLMDISSAWRKASDDAMSILEIGQGGMIDLTSLMTDLGSSIISNRDALQASAKTVIEFRDQNQLLIGTLGNNLEEVSQAFRRNRDAVDDAFGEDFLGKIPFDEQNVIMSEMLDLQRRAGVKSEMSTILASQASRTQLQYLQEISFQTGQTVKEVMKLYKEEAKSMQTLEALGLLKPGEAAKATMSSKRLEAGGQGAMAETLKDIIRAGSIGQWMAKEEGNAAFAAQGNNTQLLVEAVEQFKIGTNASTDRITTLASQLKNLEMGSTEGAGGILEALPGLEKLATLRLDAQSRSAAGASHVDVAAAKAKQDASFTGGLGNTIASTYNDVKEFLENNFGATGSLVIAVLANTAALVWNTLKMGKGGVDIPGGPASKTPKGGAKGGMMKGLKNLGGRAMGSMGTMARGVGSVVTGAGAATVAAAAAAAYGIYQAGQAMFTGRSDVNDALNSTETGRSIGESIAKGMTHIGAMFGLDSAEETLRIEKMLEDMKNKELTPKRSDVGKTGTPLHKGVAPKTAGDVAVVAPSGVVSSESVKAPTDDPINLELIRHTAQFEAMIMLMTSGNIARQSLLDLGHNRINPEGKPSWLSQFGKSTKAGESFTPLLEEGAS